MRRAWKVLRWLGAWVLVGGLAPIKAGADVRFQTWVGVYGLEARSQTYIGPYIAPTEHPDRYDVIGVFGGDGGTYSPYHTFILRVDTKGNVIYAKQIPYYFMVLDSYSPVPGTLWLAGLHNQTVRHYTRVHQMVAQFRSPEGVPWLKSFYPLGLYGQYSYNLPNTVAFGVVPSPTQDRLMVLGHTSSKYVGQGPTISRFDREGFLIWTHVYQPVGEFRDCRFASNILRTLTVAPQGGYQAIGHTMCTGIGRGDIWALQVDDHGRVLDSKVIRGDLTESAHWIQPTRDGSFLIGGFISGYYPDYRNVLLLLKWDGKSTIRWARVFWIDGDIDRLTFRGTPDGGVAVLLNAQFRNPDGTLQPPSPGFWRFDAQGYLAAQRFYRFKDEVNLVSLQPTSDGGFLIAGILGVVGRGERLLLMKTDPAGQAFVPQCVTEFELPVYTEDVPLDITDLKVEVHRIPDVAQERFQPISGYWKDVAPLPPQLCERTL
ncbi:hypothetical protein HRbin11_01095 [bacterium HR11]|nr:hypothetical protein HRbin11_01095 [bacterium HR11]